MTAEPLTVSKREAGRRLKIDHSGATMRHLVRTGLLREIPWGSSRRITLESIQEVARSGFSVSGGRHLRPSRRRSPGLCDPEALRRLDLESL